MKGRYELSLEQLHKELAILQKLKRELGPGLIIYFDKKNSIAGIMKQLEEKKKKGFMINETIISLAHRET